MLDIEPLSLGEHKGSSEMNCFFCVMMQCSVGEIASSLVMMQFSVGEIASFFLIYRHL